eukprot:NODE_1479_length_1130_cov_284.080000.p1 GENE.NODE_1479_length_1130_cov_284.080000~~NODE_1479_length_1130_cov_284.080000.p1  ORF type:complete len:359 (-),score=118.37 NODE_1479_length_1130_cov_284.080000:35-1012(-)
MADHGILDHSLEQAGDLWRAELHLRCSGARQRPQTPNSESSINASQLPSAAKPLWRPSAAGETATGLEWVGLLKANGRGEKIRLMPGAPAIMQIRALNIQCFWHTAREEVIFGLLLAHRKGGSHLRATLTVAVPALAIAAHEATELARFIFQVVQQQAAGALPAAVWREVSDARQPLQPCECLRKLSERNAVEVAAAVAARRQRGAIPHGDAVHDGGVFHGIGRRHELRDLDGTGNGNILGSVRVLERKWVVCCAASMRCILGGVADAAATRRRSGNCWQRSRRRRRRRGSSLPLYRRQPHPRLSDARREVGPSLRCEQHLRHEA